MEFVLLFVRRTILIVLVFLCFSCGDDDQPASEFTGKELSYTMHQVLEELPISGTATFKEKINGDVQLFIKLSGTSGDIKHPTHIHFDKVEDGGDVAILMNPVEGTSGESLTVFNKRLDETAITFDDLTTMNACIRIHLDNETNKKVAIAAGNIGSNDNTVCGLCFQ